MFDKSLIIEAFDNIENSLNDVLEWTKNIVSVNDFLTSNSGTILLNAVCMKIFAVGEELKNIDKRTGGQLFPLYPSVDWKEAMKMRDIIGHHYFEIDAEVVFDTIQDDIPLLLPVVIKIKKDLKMR